MLCLLSVVLRERSLAWELSLTADRCSLLLLLLPLWFGGESLDSPSPLSLDRTGDLLCSKLESSFNYKLGQLKSSEKCFCGITASNSSISAGMRPGLNKTKQCKMYGGLENTSFILNIRLKAVLYVFVCCWLFILNRFTTVLEFKSFHVLKTVVWP